MKFDMSVARSNSIIENIRDLKEAGSIVEIGVGGGATSVMINHALKYISQEIKYICIVNFSGFTD